MIPVEIRMGEIPSVNFFIGNLYFLRGIYVDIYRLHVNDAPFIGQNIPSTLWKMFFQDNGSTIFHCPPLE